MTNECRRGIEGLRQKLVVELGMWGAIDVNHETIVGDDVLASARVVEDRDKRAEGGCRITWANECRNGITGVERKLGVEVEIQGAIDVSRETVDGGEVFVGVQVVNVGCKAIGVGDIVAGACVVDVSHEAVDVGCEVVDEDNTLAGATTSPSMSLVTSSPSAATSISFVCPLAPPTSASSCQFSSSLAL